MSEELIMQTQDVAETSLEMGSPSYLGKGDKGDDGIGIVSIIYKESTAKGNVYTVTLTDGTSYDITAPKGEQGNTGNTGPAGPQGIQGIQGPKGDTGTFRTVEATVDTNSGTPAVDVSYNGQDVSFAFHNLKGQPGADGQDGAQGAPGTPGAAAGFGTPTATVDANVGTPSVTVTASGADTSKVFSFAFHNLKGQQGQQGVQGIPGTNGADGEDGKSAYESAQDGGYTGTEQQFNTDLAAVSGKVNIAQGVAHAGKFLVVGSDGNITTRTLSAWEGGSY